ncbi:hypothetical protein GWI33_014217 [Rhynchophorus ferrugineus]|uniref:Uncharacterized protein n=1 Tax=Rhynchophorus ferrugineus TaxID=354439 RepID=A0A834I7L7_RHYFE|nr:hypothetical protein GWI33_014217 [Rhynchophorus ferrugineus]
MFSRRSPRKRNRAKGPQRQAGQTRVDAVDGSKEIAKKRQMEGARPPNICFGSGLSGRRVRWAVRVFQRQGIW